MSTRPASICDAIRLARSRSVPLTKSMETVDGVICDGNGFFVWFCKVIMEMTGPKISSCAIVISLVTLTKTVGFTKLPAI